MKTPQQFRRERLESDYQEMCNIRGAMIQWEPLSGTAPHIEAYHLTVRVRTLIGPDRYRESHEIDVVLPPGYPHSPPDMNMLTKPQPFHVNWYLSGKWCPGSNWSKFDPLGREVIRMIRTLQFDSEITNVNSAANPAARDWYTANLRRGIFPTDTQVLPDPSKRRLEIVAPAKKRFEIL